MVSAGEIAATPSCSCIPSSWNVTKKTSIGTSTSSPAEAMLPTVSVAGQRSRHPEPGSCSACCAAWRVRFSANYQAVSIVPQVHPSSRCWPADGACTQLAAPPILMAAGRQWSGCARWNLCGYYGVWRTPRYLQLCVALKSAAVREPHRFCDHRSSYVDSVCHCAALGTRV